MKKGYLTIYYPPEASGLRGRVRSSGGNEKKELRGHGKV